MVSTAGGIVIAVLVVLTVAAVGWVVFTQLRARRLGLPPPSLSSYIPFLKSNSSPYGPQAAPGGVVGWFNDRVRDFKNRNNRTASGAYEEPLQAGPGPSHGRRGGALDPDEAWDSRVGQEADGYGPAGYYEEQEQGQTAYKGGSYSMNLAATPGAPPAGFGDGERGRPLSRSPGPGLAPPRKNPFDDDVAEPSNVSLRGISPRPIDTAGASGQHGRGKDPDSAESPTERRSIFRENV